MYLDHNGVGLAVGNKVAVLGVVASTDGDHAVVTVTRQNNNAASIGCLRSEPVVYEMSGPNPTGVITGDQVDQADPVMFIGEVTELTDGIHKVAIVRFTLNGEPDDQTFFCDQLYKVSVDQITGVVSGPGD